MADPKDEDTSLQIAKITSRSQILTALIGVSSGIVIAVLGSDALFSGDAPVGCDVAEVGGRYGENEGWEFEMDLTAGQFESEQQAGPGRIDGNVTAICTPGRLAARVEGRRAEGGAPVLCLFDGTRTGSDGRAVSGRFMCDDMTPAQRQSGYWQGQLLLLTDA